MLGDHHPIIIMTLDVYVKNVDNPRTNIEYNFHLVYEIEPMFSMTNFE